MDLSCKYGGCTGKALGESDYCILHIDLPDDLESDEFAYINNLKQQEVEKKKSNGDFNFKGVKLFEGNFNNINTPGDVIFTKTMITGVFDCSNSEIKGDFWFDQGIVDGHVFIENSLIGGSFSFYRGRIGGNLSFDETIIGKYAWFEELDVEGETSFNHSKIGASLSFKGSHIRENVSFYSAQIGGSAWFIGALLDGSTWFDLSEFKGGLNFRNAVFKDFKGQERACRTAKTIWERIGDREKADYHFYHEMEAKRRQKPIFIRYPELIVQYPFGYGVHPSRLLFTFVGVMFCFALVFWVMGNSYSTDAFLEKLKFSFLTMIIPAYGVINAKTGLIGVFTIIEAFIGAFTWPTFIVTFARKYMR
ncbi:MAG TPA: hypothetical protein HA271_08670 [Methanobacterium subterraneum]|uniref:Pentapeptide repeat-containing protein n=1 Tax=Methanobacterium subterraneum TaxID=59277 RepID=A0A7J4TMY7_9EURY|nr:hypothetical protein [Methanobacterium subterraneum]